MEKILSWIALIALIFSVVGLCGWVVTHSSPWDIGWLVAQTIACICIFCGGSKNGLK